jgi:hypothetical protein
VLSCALIALALVGSALPIQAQTAPASRPAARAATTSYSVYYRKAGTVNWTESRAYATVAEANAFARGLYERGYEVQVHSRVTMKTLPARPKTGTLPVSDTVTEQQAGQIFRWLANQRSIAFRYPADGCYARAYLMIRLMQKRGYKPYKVWTFQNGDPLYVRTNNHPAGHVEWRYHVAPILRVRNGNGQQRWVVIDPALFQVPATIRQWRDVQRKPGSRYTPYVTLTRLGQAPKDAKGAQLPGSGYWPGADPREGVDAHSVKVMRLYKPYEGRIAPKTLAAGDHLPRLNVLPLPQQKALVSRRESLLAA